jgi:hypothetical protein
MVFGLRITLSVRVHTLNLLTTKIIQICKNNTFNFKITRNTITVENTLSEVVYTTQKNSSFPTPGNVSLVQTWPTTSDLYVAWLRSHTDVQCKRMRGSSHCMRATKAPPRLTPSMHFNLPGPLSTNSSSAETFCNLARRTMAESTPEHGARARNLRLAAQVARKFPVLSRMAPRSNSQCCLLH